SYKGSGEPVRLEAGTDFTVKIGNTVIGTKTEIEDKFDIYYADNTCAGKASVILKGRTDSSNTAYVGTVTKKYDISKPVIR
ncbi:MAG: hypothetical protein IK139_04350, partial [Lachnospiraceae bacterium]|nr:hypothetical protein [Lachnospiraceae bacterium]